MESRGPVREELHQAVAEGARSIPGARKELWLAGDVFRGALLRKGASWAGVGVACKSKSSKIRWVQRDCHNGLASVVPTPRLPSCPPATCSTCALIGH